MRITLNGSVFMDGKEIYFEDFDVELDKELDLPFDDFDCDIEEYIEDCEDCGFCDFDCEDCDTDDEDEIHELRNDLVELLEVYTDIISETVCPECITEILMDLLSDVLDVGSR